MAEKKVNVLICGLTSDSFPLFISLYKYLKSIGHKVSFFVPEYSGAVCLINENIPFITLKDTKPRETIDSTECEFIDSCITYDLKKSELETFLIKNIVKKKIRKESQLLYFKSVSFFTENTI